MRYCPSFFSKSDILALGSVGQRAVGATTGHDHVGGIRHLIPDALTNLPNLDKLGTRDNHAGLVDYADDPTANGILHLVDDIYIKSKELHFNAEECRVVFLIKFFGKTDMMPYEMVQNMFPDRTRDYVIIWWMTL